LEKSLLKFIIALNKYLYTHGFNSNPECKKLDVAILFCMFFYPKHCFARDLSNLYDGKKILA
tara:strand:+ start:351 stop:536 length:186 start_codon:yes stop_codon:yes gene_type:complete